MEEGMDPRRGNQWASLDMNYQLGSSSSDRGSGSSSNMNNNNSNNNNNNNRITKFQEEAGESSSTTSGSTFGNLEAGKGVDSSRPSSQQPSPKLVVAARASSGGQRVQRSLLQGQWTALHGFVADNDLNDAGLDHHGGNTGLGLGLSSTSSQQLGVSEEIIVHPAHVQSGFSARGSRPGIFEGRTGGQVVGDSIINGDGIGNNRQVSHGDDDDGGRNGLVERTLDDDSVGGNLTYNSLFMMNQLDLGNDDGRSVMDEQGEENSGAAGSISTTTTFFLEQRPDLQKEAQFQGGSSSSNNNNNFAGATEMFLEGATSRSQGLYNDVVVGSGTDGLHCVEDIHSLRSNSGGNIISAFDNSPSAGYGHVSTSSRSSACKRKSCAPVPPGSLSAPTISNSPHRTAFRENLSRSALRSLEIVPSTFDSPSVEWCSAPPQVPSRLEWGTSLLREQPVEDSFPELSLRGGEGRHGKSVAGSSSSASGTTNSQRSLRTGGVGVVLTDPAANPLPQNSSSSFSRASRRASAAAVPMLPDSFARQRTSLSFSSSMDAADEGSPSFVVDHMSNTVGHQARQQSEISLLGGGGGGGGGSRRDTFFGTTSTLGERFTHRYLGNNAVASVSSANHQRSLRGSINHHHHHHHMESSSMPSHISPPQSPPLPLTLQSSVRTSSSPSPSRPPPHPPVLRRSSINNSLLPPPSPSSGPAPSRLPPSPPSPLNPLLFSPSIHSLPSPTALFRGSLLPASSSSTAAGVHDRGFASAAESLLGMPFRGLHMPAGSDGGTQPRIVAEGLAEILLALERVERDEDLTYEQLLMLEATLLFGGMGLHDQHSDLRLDVDNMSYEELLALEERIGNVSTGLTPDEVVEKLKKSYYSSLDAVTASYSEEYDIKCSICQEEYEDGDELGKIDCGHGYHVQCIQQWLVQKNQCPICKAAA